MLDCEEKNHSSLHNIDNLYNMILQYIQQD